MWFDDFQTPVGRLVVAADAVGLRHIRFETERHPLRPHNDWQRNPDALREAREQLLAYFSGELRHFELVLQPVGTEFQRKVWSALANIPYGTTTSYGEIALRIGEPKAVRAVGAANGRNPLPIVLPCHRVIGSDGSLTGFGGGLPIKRFLLDHEGVGQASLGF